MSDILRDVPPFARPESPAPEPAPSGSAPAERPGVSDRTLSPAKIFRRLEVTRWLCESQELDLEHAAEVAEQLILSAPAIRGVFYRWWKTGQVQELEIEGYCLRRLVEEKGMSELGALLTLSLLEEGSLVTGRTIDAWPEGDLRVEEVLRRFGGEA